MIAAAVAMPSTPPITTSRARSAISSGSVSARSLISR